jgi:hypothetical protein
MKEVPTVVSVSLQFLLLFVIPHASQGGNSALTLRFGVMGFDLNRAALMVGIGVILVGFKRIALLRFGVLHFGTLEK